MPAIYTFSLDFSRDRDIIDLFESKKNRSDYIRCNLRKELLEQLYIDAFHAMYQAYATTMRVHAGRDPMPKDSFLARNLPHAKQESEEECFTCREIGEEHCNIHKSYSEE